MMATFMSNKISLNIIQVSVILLGLLVVGNWAAPTADELQEIYLDTCQAGCGVVKNTEESKGCHEKFCPNYVNYLLTGTPIPGSSLSHVSSHHKDAAEFCATWMINLIQELGWQKRNRLNLKECTCAAGKECFVE